MIEMYGNLFDTEQLHIGHGVNVDGVMGAGVAVEFKHRFPRNYDKYSRYCREGRLLPGQMVAAREKGWTIHNIASQDAPGPHARYEWLASGMRESARTLMSFDGMPDHRRVGYQTQTNLLAIPEIGCGIGGLDWAVVRLILLGIEKAEGREHLFEVWHYQP